MDVVADWVSVLRGKGSLCKGLSGFMRLFDADGALLLRKSSDRVSLRQIAVCDVHDHKFPAVPRRSYAQQMLNDHLSDLSNGALVTLSECEREGLLSRDAMITLRTQLSANGIREVCVIRLCNSKHQADLLELHLAHSPSSRALEMIAALAPTIAKTWSDRLPGTAERAAGQVRVHRMQEMADPASLPILDAANPLGLTRSEFRVCTLVREGITVREIARKLAVQEATVRSHLRSVFMKTGTSCHVELLHRLALEATRSIEQVEVARKLA
ncbi:helix-turn-helix transcriptional regulator [Actibacterium sp. XHP0104]|uniref:helix-turn-helix transcriptional regulator n=1 Tax=Actibacterium sp. XHP0104 TaxID=2984335 RepID=UPI0021E7CB11|nr:LuxR family transcriptional regulator [Actibacterium sp. XHP0104]MCV2882966.1 LuxR C-terminal-related transcriptional regulator [Actibacterium sp. XHP0104]